MRTHTTPAVPDAPAGWFLSEYPAVGALVVPLGNTEADVADALAGGWRPLQLTKANTRTGRATARNADGAASPVVYSGRGGGWRHGGRWVQFATPRTPLVGTPAELAADGPSYAAVPLADEPAPATRPAWLYTNGTAPEGEPTPEGAELDDDAPDTTPRPAPSVFAQAAVSATAACERHAATCPRCVAEAAGGGWCAVWTALARRAADAHQAALGALAVQTRR